MTEQTTRRWPIPGARRYPTRLLNVLIGFARLKTVLERCHLNYHLPNPNGKFTFIPLTRDSRTLLEWHCLSLGAKSHSRLFNIRIRHTYKSAEVSRCRYRVDRGNIDAGLCQSIEAVDQSSGLVRAL